MEQAVMLDNTDLSTKKENIIKLNKDDNKGFTLKCPPKYYKGALVVDPNHTYHFFRQDSSGRFSHKPGTLPVENVDSVNDPIYAPHLSDKNYTKDDPYDEDGIHYDQNCRYFCIPRNYREKTKAI